MQLSASSPSLRLKKTMGSPKRLLRTLTSAISPFTSTRPPRPMPRRAPATA